MKKLAIVAFFALLNLNCYSQIIFEDGYFIKDTGERINCLIKNVDWKNNPTSFKYKLSEDSKVKIANIEFVKEFGINGASTYERHSVKIDRSSSEIEELSIQRRAIFNVEQLFLEVLVEGEATLYDYEDGNIKRYFYRVNDGDVKQLVYKKYKTFEGEKNAGGSIRENKLYRQQIFNQVNCEDISMDDIEDIDYKKKDLINHFTEYNYCKNAEFTNFTVKDKRDVFNLNFRIGLHQPSLVVQSNNSKYDFGSEFSFKFGAEAEFILPFNKGKWSAIVEPTYQYFDSALDTGFQTVEANYHSIELPIGIRHYFFLNDNSKLFLNGGIVVDLSMGSTVDINAGYSLDIKSRETFAFGAGYNLNNKYSIELRYMPKRQILTGLENRGWSSDYNSLSIILGYNLF